MSEAQISAEPQAQTSLRGFWALLAVQFQGAFSDNTLKWLVSFVIIDSAASQQQRDLWFVLVVPLLFAVPFLLFSIPGGYFADKYSKRSVTIWTKLFEFAVMALATFALAGGHFLCAAFALFLACTQGAIFGPTKYGLLPELLPYEKLSWGNGMIEFTTLLAAILAALAGGFLATKFHGRQIWSGVIFLALTALGGLASLGITRVPAAAPNRRFGWNVPREFFRDLGQMRRDHILWIATWANTFFWFLGALLLLNIVLMSTDVLHVDDAHSGYLLAALSMGIGVGSFLAGYASGKKIEPGMILPGMAGIVVMCCLLWRSWWCTSAVAAVFRVASGPSANLHFNTVLGLLVFLGIAGGFFVVPVNALIQRRPRAEDKGRVIAVANFLSFIGVALQPLAQYTMLRLGHPNPSRVFLIAGIFTVAVAVLFLRLLPELGPEALHWTRLRRSAIL